MSRTFDSTMSLVALALQCAQLVAASETIETDSQQMKASEVLPFVDEKYLRIFEYLLGAFTCGLIYNYFRGAAQNQAMANAIVSVLNPRAMGQFWRIGHNEDGVALMRDGPADFWYYATGRRYATGMSAQLKLQNRQDLIAALNGSIASAPPKDVINLVLPLSEDFAMEPISLLAVKRQELKRMKAGTEMTLESLKAVETLAGEIEERSTIIDEDFTVFADHAETITTMFNSRIRGLIADAAPWISSIHVTDSGGSWDMQCAQTKRFVRVSFAIPPTTSEEELEKVIDPCLQIAVGLVDLCGTVKLPAAARTKALELRRRVAAVKQKAMMKKRQEALAEKKLQKEREEQERIAKMSAADQAKYEKKKKKKDLRSKMMKGKM